MQCYSIKDEKADCFFTPYYAKSQTDAVRGVTTEVNNPQSNLNLYSDDFAMYLLGVVDMQTGIITPHKNGPERIVQLSILKREVKKQ